MALGRRRASAPGLDAPAYEVLGLLGQATAAVKEWCRHVGGDLMPRRWRDSVLALLHKGCGGGVCLSSPRGTRIRQPALCREHLDYDGRRPMTMTLQLVSLSRRSRVNLAAMPLRFAAEKWEERGAPLHLLHLYLADASGSAEYPTMWRAVSTNMCVGKTWPVERLILGTEADPMRRGGRQCTVEMPQLWEAYLDHALGKIAE